MSKTLVSSGCPRNTPWGQAQGTPEQLCRGVYFVSTASHGGVYVARERRAEIPACLSAPPRYADGGWYEEDCEWAIPFIVFWQELALNTKATYDDVRDTLRNWYPAKYEAFFRVTLKPGESHVRDEENFKQEHAHHWMVISAYGSWHEKVPEGMVGVATTVGGKHGAEVPHKYFLVPAAEYAARGRHGFVIDENAHLEVKESF